MDDPISLIPNELIWVRQVLSGWIASDCCVILACVKFRRVQSAVTCMLHIIDLPRAFIEDVKDDADGKNAKRYHAPEATTKALPFIDAPPHLYKWMCPSVRPSIHSL